MRNKTILIVGAGPDQLPAIKMAKKFGCRVLATDKNPNSIGFEFADGHALISTNDSSATLRYARDNNIDAITTLVSETGIPVVAYVNKKLKLAGIDPKLAFLATNKLAMRDTMKSKACSVPAYERVDSYQSAKNFVIKHGLPVVIKPSDSSGQSGVRKIESLSQLSTAYDEAIQYATDNLAIIEEFVQGPEINVTALVNQGVVTILSLSDRVTAEPPHFGIATHHVAPPELNDEQTNMVMQAAVCSIQSIEMNDGIAYPQIIVDQTRNKVYIIEIAARIPGGHMREVALYLSGIDMVKCAIHQAFGDKFTLEDVSSDESVYPAVIVEFLTALNTLSEGSTIKTISGFSEVQSLPGIKLAYCNLHPGEKIPKLDSSRARFGVLLSVGNSKQECIRRLEEAKSHIVIS